MMMKGVSHLLSRRLRFIGWLLSSQGKYYHISESSFLDGCIQMSLGIDRDAPCLAY